MTFEKIEVWPVQLSLFYWFWHKQYSFHLISLDFGLKIGRERTIRVLNGRFLFSDDWLLHASLHSGWSTHTIGDILWQVATPSYSRNQQVHKESCTQDKYQVQGIKYKVSRCNGSRSRKKYDHFSIATAHLHLKFETCLKKNSQMKHIVIWFLSLFLKYRKYK